MRKTDNTQRAYWLKTLHQWHWISSAVCLLGMLLFSVTGITLNHASQIESRPAVTARELQLPPELKALVAPDAPSSPSSPRAPLPARLADWVDTQLAVDVRGRDAEWSDEELYVSLPRPGGDAWLRIDRESGAAEYERTDRGWISYLNDLHKGRHTGVAWSWFIDVFAVACLVFCLTGLFILKLHAANRPTTWPIVGLGLVIPLLLALLFIH
ncbi:PepSY-associated TM helix domain-containing protein [Methylibium sp.]|uniref:PepSY-associated TM helix domain-containing protein n=1 Tax=Methylibium sp. TaxID=2067992 RepID=UPI003341D1FD